MSMIYRALSDSEDYGRSAEEKRRPSKLSWGSKDVEKMSKRPGLMMVVGLVVIAVLLVPSTSALPKAFFRTADNREMCQTEKCIKTAKRMINAMNKSVNPCDDFYEFACGGWIASNPIPQSRSSWDQFDLLKNDVLKDLRIILEEPDREVDPRPVKLARLLYKTCMDTASVENLGLEPIFDVFKAIRFPREPPFDNETAEFNLAEIAGIVQRHLGFNIFVDFYIFPNTSDTTRNRMTLAQVSPAGFSEQYLLDPQRFSSELDEYKRYIKSMVQIAGAGNRSDEIADELLNFSTKIAKIMVPPEQQRGFEALEGTVGGLQRMTDRNGHQWNWTTYLDAVFNDTNVTLDAKEDRIIMMDARYLRKLPRLLAETSQGTIARFVWWIVYSEVAPLTLQKFRDLKFGFWKIFGFKEATPRWEECTNIVIERFDMALTHVWVENHFNETTKKKALEMLLEVKAAFNETLDELEWMPVETRARAHRKLDAMRLFVGFPEWVTDSEKLDKYYEGAEVIEGKFLATFIRLTYVKVKENLNSLREKPDKNGWIGSGTDVNAFFDQQFNFALIPAGILQPPYYGNGLESIDYGAIGTTMGHELTHGFDDQGRQYDENGNIKEWWSNETLHSYLEKVECMIEQYSNYHPTQLSKNFTVNGIITQSENIADNGGIQQAYRAYQRRQARRTSQQALPGLADYSEDQLFFLSFAQFWCGHETEGGLKSQLIEDPHVPNNFRVIGTLSNNEEFAKAWSCPLGSPMNPPHKCIVW